MTGPCTAQNTETHSYTVDRLPEENKCVYKPKHLIFRDMLHKVFCLD